MSGAATPYDPPESIDLTGPPQRVTVLAVFCLLLGLFGFFGSFANCANGFFEQFADLNPPGTPAAQIEAERALVVAARPVTAVKLGVGGLGVLPLAVLLAGGAILLFASRSRGARWLEWAFVYGFVLEPIRLGIELFSVVYLLPEYRAVAAAAVPSVASPTGPPPAFRQLYMVALVGSALVMIAWTAVKLAFYAWGRRSLRAGPTRDWLASIT